MCGSSDEKYTKDSLNFVFSSGKSIGAILMAVAHDKSLIDYDQKVSKYWHEFAKNGKDKITIADVLRHESGMHQLATPICPLDLST